MFFSGIDVWADLPPTVIVAIAPCPARGDLVPLTLGTLAKWSPVPLDSALVLIPAKMSLPCGWTRWDWIATTALRITSLRTAVAKTGGNDTVFVDSPSRPNTGIVLLLWATLVTGLELIRG
jgi:hypothetical protein